MSDQQDQATLTLGDRINFPFIIASYLLKFGDAIVQPEGAQSEQQVREAALVLFNSMPDVWIMKDLQLRRDLDHAIIKKNIDLRPVWCGQRIGPKKEEEVEEINPYRLYNACINVFQRRGYLSKIIYTEKIVPEPEDFEETEGKEEQVTDVDQKELEKYKAVVNKGKTQ